MSAIHQILTSVTKTTCVWHTWKMRVFVFVIHLTSELTCGPNSPNSSCIITQDFRVPYRWHWVRLSADTRSKGGWRFRCWTTCTRNIRPLRAKIKKQSTSIQTVQWESAVRTINHACDTLIKQLLSYGCIIGCCRIISPSVCLHRGVQFNVLIFSKSFCLMTFYQCYYDFINISISAVNDHISQRSPV